MNIVLISTVIVAAVGIFVGLFLGVAGIKFKVEVDEREEKILGVLPGNNCGGCGFPGCSGLAAAIVAGNAPVNQCPVGGEAVGAQVAAIMGVEAEAGEKKVAYVHCMGDCEQTHDNYQYTGIEDCTMLSFVPNAGPKSCRYGCCGGGTCVKACQFGAISIVKGIAVIDKDLCKACGKCVEVCPRHIISMEPYNAKCIVTCSSKDKGAAVNKACKTGCIGCGVCKKNCPSEAIEVTDNLAAIDQSKCTGCGTCAEKCPKKVIAS